MIGALIIGFLAGAIGRWLMPKDAFRHMSGPKSWGVSLLLGLAGALVGYLIFTVWLGIGSSKVFGFGGFLAAIFGVILILPVLTVWLRIANRRKDKELQNRQRAS